MFKLSVVPLVLAATCGNACVSHAQSTQWDKAKMEALFHDPMFVSSVRGGRVIKEVNELYPFDRGGFARRIQYKRMFKQGEIGNFSSWQYPGGANAVLISVSADAPPVDQKANWKTLTRKWDSFVARHWPNAAFRRVEDPGQSAFPKKSPYFYDLSVSYSLVQQGVKIADIELSVQPEDGKICRVSCHDDRELMRGFVVPPVLSKAQIQKAMRLWASTELKNGETLDVSSGTIGERSLDFDFAHKRTYTSTSVSFRAIGTKGWGTTIYGRHNDAAGQIESWTTHPDEQGMKPAT